MYAGGEAQQVNGTIKRVSHAQRMAQVGNLLTKTIRKR